MALDPSYFFYSEGTISLTNGSDIATGEFVAWDPAVLPFDFVFPNDGLAGMSVIEEVLAMDQIRLAKPWTGPTLTDVPYFMVRWTRHTDPRVYAVRVSDYLARLKAIPENLEEVAGEINADRQAIDAAMVLLSQIQTNVDADRQAAEAAAGTALGSASAAAESAVTAQEWAEAASSGVLPDNGVTNAKLADMATATIKGRVATGTGDPQDLTAAQARAVLGMEFKKAYPIDVASDVPLIVIDVPSDANLVRVSGFMMGAQDQVDLWARFSLDGSTYISQANGYWRNAILGLGTSSAPSLSYSTETGLTYAQLLTTLSNNANFPALLEALFNVGSAATTPSVQALGNGVVSGIGTRMAITNSRLYTIGRVQRIGIFASAGNIKAGSKLFVEII
jgi:hypothetical protein